MPEGLGEFRVRVTKAVKSALASAWEFSRKALPDSPTGFQIPIDRINPSTVLAAYQRWINYSPYARLVKDENRYPPFTLAQIMWALGYLGKYEPLDKYAKPQGEHPQFQDAHDNAYQALSQLHLGGIIELTRRNPLKVEAGQLNYYYIIPTERRQRFARMAESTYEEFYSK